ncbi:MAG: tRNA lysidine(34) synthetase TilS, partial [Ktedonobacterales bacterium]
MSNAQQRLIARVERAVRAAVEQDGLWAPGATVVAAVSGGADSLCLLGALHALARRGVPSAPGLIVVVHLDHGLRGADGAEDAAFVVAFARERGLECVVERADVAAVARREHRSIEDAARQVRYAFLRRVARDMHAERIVTGHTRDDQAETVLMRLLRGSGISGLAGMAPLAGDIARPLLAVPRAETGAYCAAHGWQPRHDATNDDTAAHRNRLRHVLLPALERENPRLRETLARNAALIGADAAYLDARAAEAWAPAVTAESEAAIVFDLAVFRALAPALRHRLLREAQRRLAGLESQVEARHLAAADAFVVRGTNGTSNELPGGLRLRRGRGT